MRPLRVHPVPILVALLSGALVAPLGAQERGSLVGIVLQEGSLTPLEGAVVELVNSGVRVGTGADGSFTLRNLPPGMLTLRVEATGYVVLVDEVEVAPLEVSLVQFRLPRLGAALEGLLVDVDERRVRSDGSRPELRPVEGGATVVDMLANQVPGVNVRRSGSSVGSAPWIVIRGFSSITQSNAPDVYVDGVRISTMDILEQIPAGNVARIRVLRGASAGTQFMEAANGVILIETRRGPSGDGDP